LKESRAFGLALLVELVPVARALVLVPVGSRRDTFALCTAYSTVLQTSILNSCGRAPIRTLAAAISYNQHRKHTHHTKFENIYTYSNSYFYVAVTENLT